MLSGKPVVEKLGVIDLATTRLMMRDWVIVAAAPAWQEHN